MRAKPSSKREAKKRSWPGTAECEAETAVFATLGIVALLAIVLALVSGSFPAKNETLSAAERSSIVKYFGSGQLAADARTLASMAQYILEPESPLTSNPSLVLPRKAAATTTNNASGTPKA
jgi:hypothetical protein